MAEQNNQAERAEFERQVLFLSIIDDEGLDQNEAGEYIDEPAQAAWLTWQAARRAALPAAVDAEGLLNLPEPSAAFAASGRAVKWHPNYLTEPWASQGYVPLYTAEQVQQIIAADRRKQAALTQMIELGQEIEASGEAEYELHQDDMMVAGTSGKRAYDEILHYAAQYVQDGPVEIYKVVRTKLAIPAAAPSHQSPGKEG